MNMPTVSQVPLWMGYSKSVIGYVIRVRQWTHLFLFVYIICLHHQKTSVFSSKKQYLII